MRRHFKQHINSEFPELLRSKFLLACSGGLDSVVLTHLCYESQMNFALAHCNFGLRGADSNADELFVLKLGKELERQVFVTHFDTLGYMNQHKVSVQMAARDLRYAWFNTILQENNLSTLVTAHHADDDLETFLINLSRGTGINGLSGIPAKTATLRRPLLAFSREQLLAYANLNHLQWREDKSNKDPKYLRNKIRSEIIPTLKELHPTFLENFKNTQ
ncbi:MAG: tRNA lysidine(34) synthetase TilS, partial [Maribacter sp.]